MVLALTALVHAAGVVMRIWDMTNHQSIEAWAKQ
jgi:hypothetical protein